MQQYKSGIQEEIDEVQCVARTVIWMRIWRHRNRNETVELWLW